MSEKIVTAEFDAQLVERILDGSVAGLSMGCQVERPSCSVCGERGCEHVTVSPLMARAGSQFSYELSPSLQFLYFTTVPAPRCPSCTAAMHVHEDRDWVCRRDECSAKGKVVEAAWFGVFPSKLSP